LEYLVWGLYGIQKQGIRISNSVWVEWGGGGNKQMTALGGSWWS